VVSRLVAPRWCSVAVSNKFDQLSVRTCSISKTQPAADTRKSDLFSDSPFDTVVVTEATLIPRLMIKSRQAFLYAAHARMDKFFGTRLFGLNDPTWRHRRLKVDRLPLVLHGARSFRKFFR
jgi:hypothetical protein